MLVNQLGILNFFRIIEPYNLNNGVGKTPPHSQKFAFSILEIIDFVVKLKAKLCIKIREIIVLHSCTHKIVLGLYLEMADFIDIMPCSDMWYRHR